MGKVADRYRAECCAAQSGCRQCGTEIPPRRAYCSNDCQNAFEREHFWSTARAEAIRRWLEADGGPVCPRCSLMPLREPKFYGGAHRKWWWQLLRFKPEVNHIVPLNRQRCRSYHFGCFNHQSNLEVVCQRCHVQITKEQRAAGLIGRPKPQLPLALGVDGGEVDDARS